MGLENTVAASLTSSGDATRRAPVPSKLYMSSADPAHGKATMRADGRAGGGTAVRDRGRPGTQRVKAGWSAGGGGGGGGGGAGLGLVDGPSRA
jgi:hypothetical protein